MAAASRAEPSRSRRSPLWKSISEPKFISDSIIIIISSSRSSGGGSGKGGSIVFVNRKDRQSEAASGSGAKALARKTEKAFSAPPAAVERRTRRRGLPLGESE